MAIRSLTPPSKPCAPSCHGTESLLAYLSSENIKEKMASCKELQDVARLHNTLGCTPKLRDGLEWDKDAWCEPIKEGLAVVVARYVHRRLSGPEVPERLRLPGTRGGKPFRIREDDCHGQPLQVHAQAEAGKERQKSNNNDPTWKNLPEHLAYIKHDWR